MCYLHWACQNNALKSISQDFKISPLVSLATGRQSNNITSHCSKGFIGEQVVKCPQIAEVTFLKCKVLYLCCKFFISNFIVSHSYLIFIESDRIIKVSWEWKSWDSLNSRGRDTHWSHYESPLLLLPLLYTTVTMTPVSSSHPQQQFLSRRRPGGGLVGTLHQSGNRLEDMLGPARTSLLRGQSSLLLL